MFDVEQKKAEGVFCFQVELLYHHNHHRKSMFHIGSLELKTHQGTSMYSRLHKSRNLPTANLFFIKAHFFATTKSEFSDFFWLDLLPGVVVELH